MISGQYLLKWVLIYCAVITLFNCHCPKAIRKVIPCIMNCIFLSILALLNIWTTCHVKCSDIVIYCSCDITKIRYSACSNVFSECLHYQLLISHLLYWHWSSDCFLTFVADNSLQRCLCFLSVQTIPILSRIMAISMTSLAFYAQNLDISLMCGINFAEVLDTFIIYSPLQNLVFRGRIVDIGLWILSNNYFKHSNYILVICAI